MFLAQHAAAAQRLATALQHGGGKGGVHVAQHGVLPRHRAGLRRQERVQRALARARRVQPPLHAQARQRVREAKARRRCGDRGGGERTCVNARERDEERDEAAKLRSCIASRQPGDHAPTPTEPTMEA